MSITGSLVGYENNNDVIKSKKNRSLLNMSGSSLKQCGSLNTSMSNSVITSASNSISNVNSKHQNTNNECKQQKTKRRFHLNSLWSIWYGILTTLFQGYLALHGAYRFLGCSFIQWRGYPPFTELNMQIILCGFVFLVLPLFLISAIIKVGNLANDSIKLATGSGKCSAEPDDGLEEEAKGGTLRALWTHGGPTSAFIHIITALCLLLPRLMLEARLIENGNLHRDHIWHTELDFLITHKDRFVVLSFMTSPYQNTSIDNSFDNNLDDSIDDAILYEKTHLIESFHSGMDNDGLFETHERLEIELPTTMQTTLPIMNTTTATLAPSPSASASAGTMFVPSSGKATTPAKTIVGNVENNNNNHNNRKHERARTGGNRQANGNGKSGTNSGRKHAAKHEHSTPSPSASKNVHGNSMKVAGEKDDSERENLGNSRRNMKKGSTNDFDERLELKPNSKYDFEQINEFEMSTVFETTKTPRKSHQRNNEERRQSNRPESTSKKVLKDSEIHIVKKEKNSDGTVQSTPPLSVDSKIIEIKPANRNNSVLRRNKRLLPIAAGYIEEYTDTSRQAVSPDQMQHLPATASPLINAVVTNITTKPVTELNGIAKCLQPYLGIDREPDMKTWSSHQPSLEFLNFILAIVVWSARYPAVFWGTSKAFSFVFSLQLIANNVDIILEYAGISVLYKIQVVGHQMPLPSPQLLLNSVVTLSLFLLSTILIISSSLILYLYGHGRLSAKIRDRRIISTKSDDSWAYFAHCASLCFVLALAVVKAPILHDLSASYRGSLDGAILASVLGSVIHLFLWIVLWLGLTAKRRWNFKLPPLQPVGTAAAQPLLVSSSRLTGVGIRAINGNNGNGKESGEDTIYWPKLTPSSPKLKVTFNDVPSTSSDHELGEHDGKRNPGRRVSLCLSSPPGEADDGDYATLRGPTGDLLHLSEIGGDDNQCDMADDTSEEGKLLACVRDDSVTYASTRDLEPPITSPAQTGKFIDVQQVLSPLAPVTVTVHTNDAHVTSTSTPRCLRRADSGVPTDALLTPKSDTTSTESSTSPPDRALSETSSGVHSGEERDEVVIRPRPPKAVIKPPQPAIQEEPFGRSTNMKMSSFNKDGKSSATLPLTRGQVEPRPDFVSHCSTMPLPFGCHQQQIRSQVFTTPTASKTQLHTTLPNGIRYANAHFLRRMPHVKNAESPYGILGLGAGHHTFSKLLQDPLCHNMAASVIPEDRDSANYSMISDHDRDMYVNAGNNIN